MDKKSDLKKGIITDVVVKPLRVIEDERGAVLHMLREDSPLFRHFGEIYFSQINPGIVKAWKRHLRMTQHFAVPTGRIKLVLYDDRETSPTEGTIVEYEIGRPDAYNLVVIPPMIWYGFKGISNYPAIMANCSDIPHDPSESQQADFNKKVISYVW